MEPHLVPRYHHLLNQDNLVLQKELQLELVPELRALQNRLKVYLRPNLGIKLKLSIGIALMNLIIISNAIKNNFQIQKRNYF